jgi:hypothetical protein
LKRVREIVAENVHPMDATAITAKFAELCEMVLRMCDTKLVGPDFTDTRTFVAERVLGPVRRCQQKVDAYSRL